MPELPETETIARGLDALVHGRRITAVTVERPDVLRETDAAGLASRLVGATIGRCWRRAKLVVLDLSTGDRLVVQPRFTGALIVDDGRMSERERRFSTLHLHLDDGRRLHYRDIRRLGTVALMSPDRFAAYVGRLGLEPLETEFTTDRLSGILRGTRQAVKKVLMDQRRVVGLGNIYANEALWLAGIDPARRANALSVEETASLREAIVGLLEASIEQGGTSFSDYVGATGEEGSFAGALHVFGRAGERCLACDTPLRDTHALDGRSTVWCPVCQR